MRKILPAVGVAAGLLAFGATTAQASTAKPTYVSPHGHASASGRSCGSARYASINAAIAATRAGGTVVVCPGTYDQQVVVTKPLRLLGDHGALINAKGQKPLKIGPVTLPGSIGVGVLGTSHVQVSGLYVEHAGFDAILVAKSSHVWVSRNELLHNGDVGVDLNGSSWSTAFGNVARYNSGGGYLVADDIGPNGHNVVSWNVASDNPGGCGVIIAGHSTAGVRDNLVEHNLLTYNGTLKSTGGGAGVVIATEVPKETVAGNTVFANTIYGNGLAGVVIHAHLPGQNLNGNRIVGNWIDTNNTLGDPIGLATSPTSKKNVAVADNLTTGVLVGSASPISVQISGNSISSNHYGVFLEGVGHIVHAAVYGNAFHHVTDHVKQVTVK